MTDRKEVIAFFKKNVPVLYIILKEINFDDWFGNEVLESDLIFKSLCRTIVGQQLAGKAADAIYGRFELLLKNEVTPQNLLKLNPDDLRAVGLSWAKVRSVIDLASRVVNKELILENLEKMDN